MKQNLTCNLVMAMICTLLTYIAKAQCPPNNIKTWPDSATNPINPALTNLNFNWASTGYSIALSNNTNTNIFAPWYQPSNSNILHFQDIPLDNSFKDGWELIKYETGYDLAGNQLLQKPTDVHLVLYNKYLALLRVFVGFGEFKSQFSAVGFNVKFVNNDAGIAAKSSLLDLSAGLIPLSTKFVPKEFYSPANIIVSPLKWFYADFPMQYDPCTCLYNSKLEIGIAEIKNMEVGKQTDGIIKGVVARVFNSSGSIDNTSSTKSWWKGDEPVVGKYAQIFKGINPFRINQQNQLNLTHTQHAVLNTQKNQSILKLANSAGSKLFIQNISKWSTVVGLGLSLNDYFVGGGKVQESTQDITFSPTAIDMSTSLVSYNQVNQTSNLKTILLQTPGAPQGTAPNANMPIYGEVLGIINIIETPEVESFISTEILANNTVNLNADFRFVKPIKYVLNPASRLQISEAKAALVLEGNVSDNIMYGFSTIPDTTLFSSQQWIYESKENSSENQYKQHWRSHLQDADCLHKWVYRTIYNASLNGVQANKGMLVSATQQSIQPYIKLYLRLKRTDHSINAQDVLIVVKYKCNLIQKQTPLFQIGENINNATSPCIINTFVQATNTEVNNFCNSEKYKNNRIDNFVTVNTTPVTSIQNNGFNLLKETLKISPNPARDLIYINFTTRESSNLRLTLLNESGMKLFIRNYTNLNDYVLLPIYVKNYAAGNYVLEISDGKNRIAKKIIITK